MRVTRSTDASFQPFSIEIHFETQRDVDLMKSLINKAKNEVHPRGIYDQMLDEIRSGVVGS